MTKVLRTWSVNAIGLGGTAWAASYAHLAWLAAVLVCALVFLAVVAGLAAIFAPEPKRRADAYKVLMAILPMFRRSQSRTPPRAESRPSRE